MQKLTREFFQAEHLLFIGEYKERLFKLRCATYLNNRKYFSSPIITVWGEAGFAIIDGKRILQIIFSVFQNLEDKDTINVDCRILSKDYLPKMLYNIKKIDLTKANRVLKLLEAMDKVTDISVMTALKLNGFARGDKPTPGQIARLKTLIQAKRFQQIMQKRVCCKPRKEAKIKLFRYGIKAV